MMQTNSTQGLNIEIEDSVMQIKAEINTHRQTTKTHGLGGINYMIWI
jgi:hypothetical protein